METILLQTKLYIPPPRPHFVPRPHLIQKLNQGLENNLTLISAPAGYGKTTLTADWLSRLPAEESPFTKSHCGWLSLDEADNQPSRFLSYFVAALQNMDDQIGQALLATLSSPLMGSTETAAFPFEPLLTTLINEITAVASAHSSIHQPFILVLDDYHLITQPTIHDMMAFLLNHQPPGLHLVITSRAEPPLPLARLRVRRQMTEIGADGLRFSLAESAAFLNQSMHLDLAEADIAHLDGVTEGWIASLQLAALSLQGAADPHAFVKTFTGDNRYIMDYLLGEVLQRQPGYVRDFLFQTSILKRLNVRLCNAVTELVGSQHILETLEQNNLFVIPLDDRRQWYRYHHLFADFLLSSLERATPELIPPLHRRASAWLARNGFVDEAVQHAFAAHDYEGAADLIVPVARTMIWNRGEMSQLWQWLERLPESAVESRAPLMITKAWLLLELFLQPGEAIEPLLQRVEKRLSLRTTGVEEETIELKSEVEIIRVSLSRHRGDLIQAIEHGEKAQALLADSKSTLIKQGAAHTLGITYLQAGDVNAASEQFALRSKLNTQEPVETYVNIVANAYYIDALVFQGRLSEAEMIFRRLQPLVANRHSPSTGMLYVSGGELLRQRNELPEAIQYLEQGVRYLRPILAMAPVIHTGAISLARSLQTQGEGAKALRILEETLSQHPGDAIYYPSARVPAVQAQLQLQQGDLPAALRWLASSGLSAEDTLAYLQEIDHLVLVRILLAQEQLPAALALLARLEAAAVPNGRKARAVEIHILQALAYQRQGKSALALPALEKAVDIGQKSGFKGVFVADGTAVADLLQQVAAHGVAVAFIRQLLPLFDSNLSRHSTSSPVLGENPLLLNPLTERELVTLRYLATELSIPEIAAQMFVAASTVRSYVKQIYSKLEAHSRIEAVNRGRQLEIID